MSLIGYLYSGAYGVSDKLKANINKYTKFKWTFYIIFMYLKKKNINTLTVTHRFYNALYAMQLNM